MLCSVDNVAEVLSEIRRVLRPGGKYVFLVRSSRSPGPTHPPATLLLTTAGSSLPGISLALRYRSFAAAVVQDTLGRSFSKLGRMAGAGACGRAQG